MTLVTVHGSWGLDDDWWRPGSAFTAEAARIGLVLPGDRPYRWSGHVAGLSTPAPGDPHERFGNPGLSEWMVAGEHLVDYCLARGLNAPSVVTHSHGLQVLACAASFGFRFGPVVDVSGPPRRDMQRVYRAALPWLGHWTHVYNEGDETLRLGQIGDGRTGFVLEVPEASENVKVESRYGHTGLLSDLPAWERYGLWARLTP